MKIKIRGVRGSISTFGPEYTTYGGNTSCTDITADGWWLILDGGSGIRHCVPNENTQCKRVDILLTHLHLDHIQGLGFFKPLFNPAMEVHIWGPASNAQPLQSRLGRYLSPPLFPVHIRELPCKLILHEIHNSRFEIGPFLIRSQYIIHPGPTVGFRITHKKSVFAYLPDHEPALGLNGIVSNRKWVSGIDLASKADLLLHDAQYSLEEYQTKRGWGHSSMDDAVIFTSLAGATKVLLAHHDPNHSDAEVLQIFTEMKKRNNYPIIFELAAEGMEFELKK